MANYFVDSTTGDDGDNGTTMDLAWATLEHALEAGGLAAGDWVWVRRIHVEFSGDPTSDISMQNHAEQYNPIRVVGWPRNTFAITSATWTNGSTTVDSILPASMDREKHCGRFVTGPDGYDYLITKITDTNTIVIDREYVGATVTSTAGAATIKADEDYTTAQAIDDSAWTIKKADYNADADDLPCIDFKNTAYQFLVDRRCYSFRNMEFRDSTDSTGIFKSSSGQFTELIGCLLYQDQNAPLIWPANTMRIKRCILSGNATGAVQSGFRNYSGSCRTYIEDCAVYDLGSQGVQMDGLTYLENVNIGIEGALGGACIYLHGPARAFGRDVKLDDTNGYISGYQTSTHERLEIENWQKTLGAHKTFTLQGEITKKDVVTGSGDPEKRTGGADSVVEILFNLTGVNYFNEPMHDWTDAVFKHEFDATTDSKSYRYYVQSQGAVTAAQIWLECEYVVSYDGTSEYVVKKVESDEAIAQRTGTTDWTQYLEVTGIQPAVASKVRIRLKCRYYHATNKIFVDPKVSIT